MLTTNFIAVAHYPAFSDHFPFYYCMEKAGEGMLNKVKSCAKTANMDYSTLNTCFSGPESEELQKAAAAATPSDHKYAPWVLIDGKLISETATLIEAVCKAYKGDKPAGCSSLKKRRNCAVDL